MKAAPDTKALPAGASGTVREMTATPVATSRSASVPDAWTVRLPMRVNVMRPDTSGLKPDNVTPSGMLMVQLSLPTGRYVVANRTR